MNKDERGGPRPGAGRHPSDEPKHYTSLGLTMDNYRKLKAAREQTGKSMAEIINDLVERYL